jgi:hypothetical protein
MTDTTTAIRIRPRRVVVVLTTVAVLLLMGHLALLLITATTGHNRVFGLVPLFDLNRENNVPSFFSGSLLLLNGTLFWLVGQLPALSHRSKVWAVLAAVFVALSYDELFGIHEHLTRPMREALQSSGLLYYPWILAYAVPLLALIAWFFPTWRRLDAVVRTGLVVAGCLYLLGAVVMEMIGGAYDEAFGRRTLGWGLLVAVEESLEMAGLIVLADTLLMVLRPSAGGLPIVFDDPT